MSQRIADEQLLLLGDGGYNHYRIVSPDDDLPKSWNQQQKSLRSVVEVVAGMVKHFETAGARFRQSPEFHEITLMCDYQLTNIILKDHPIKLV